MIVCCTSTVCCLIPQNPLQVSGPGLLQVHAGGPQGVGVLTLPSAEPDLKTEAAHTRVMGHPNVICLREKTEIFTECVDRQTIKKSIKE